ncbi:hypothetical protein M885DRAFT_567030 [Pelagophyceae sp. CCMP2097]|nr:hypothetical protein M885DRAFT_567030 [Pelagophyceae sp. CCMP2097]
MARGALVPPGAAVHVEGSRVEDSVEYTFGPRCAPTAAADVALNTGGSLGSFQEDMNAFCAATAPRRPPPPPPPARVAGHQPARTVESTYNTRFRPETPPQSDGGWRQVAPRDARAGAKRPATADAHVSTTVLKLRQLGRSRRNARLPAVAFARPLDSELSAFLLTVNCLDTGAAHEVHTGTTSGVIGPRHVPRPSPAHFAEISRGRPPRRNSGWLFGL